MPTRKMHANEVVTDVSLVRRLLAAQFPRWADLPITPVASAGTDNAIYRLGDDMAVRLPRIDWAVGQVAKEHEWLPRLAPHVPLAIPHPLAMGTPAEGYPWHWSVYLWLEGGVATVDSIGDFGEAAAALARFVAALHRVDPTGGPLAGASGSDRGVPVAKRDHLVRNAIAATAMPADIDTGAVTSAWEAALEAPAWDAAPVWVHGDLQSGNLLQVGGRLSAVIDFGCLGVGDPACDLIAAWELLSAESRELFRATLDTTLGIDDATWARGRGWALSVALIALPYYVNSNPRIVARSRHTIDEVITDHARS